MSPRLVLWDIDHTLITVRGLYRRLFREAFEALTGTPPVRMFEAPVRPDLATAVELLELNRLAPTVERLERFRIHLEEAMDRSRDDMARWGRAAPGAAEVLAALAGRPGVVQTVVTGNARHLAEVKLGTFGLLGPLDLEVGAYGWEATERWRLVVLARERARRKHGADFTERNTVVVGDTPQDVEGARRGGAAVVGVATGRSTASDLEAAGADVVLTGLEDVNRVLQALDRLTGGGPCPPPPRQAGP